ncbi:hypothetical protein Y032_0111g258 [Ancylostoma ceylanicum]|uniref:Uncharacterized protein n=1 Tax=Ancylostoma ceylanicum TaxID=53326 RepID=A0A016TEG2_9BILA|nr:hypothetical protein Y032_0111g258 [Ancylostoma ceylanicum]
MDVLFSPRSAHLLCPPLRWFTHSKERDRVEAARLALSTAARQGARGVVTMNINQESSGCCNCMHITKLIYAVFSTTIITHSIVSLVFLFYGQWAILLALAVIIAAHVIFILGIRKLSYKLLIAFVVYESCAILALIVVDVWTLVVMELAPGSSFLQNRCLRSEPSSPNSCIRRKAGVLGGIALVTTIINCAFVWPVLRNYLVFLKESPSSTLAATAMDPELFARGGAQAQVPAAAPYLGPVDNPNFRKFTPSSYGQSPVQPYSIYAPLRDPLALGGPGELPPQYPNQQFPTQQFPTQQFPNQQFSNQQFPNQQFPNPNANPAFTQASGTSAAPMQYYQQNIALGSRAPGEDMPSQRGPSRGRNALYDQVAIPLGGSAKDFQYPGSPSPNSSDTDNELPQKYPKTSTSRRYNGYDSNLDRNNDNPSSEPWEGSSYPRNPYNSESRARGYGAGFTRDNDQDRTERTSAYPRKSRHSRYPSDPDQPYNTTSLARDPGQSVMPSEIEPLPDY